MKILKIFLIISLFLLKNLSCAELSQKVFKTNVTIDVSFYPKFHHDVFNKLFFEKMNLGNQFKKEFFINVIFDQWCSAENGIYFPYWLPLSLFIGKKNGDDIVLFYKNWNTTEKKIETIKVILMINDKNFDTNLKFCIEKEKEFKEKSN